MTKKPFVHPLRDSLTPADLRLLPLLGAFRTSGAVPSGLFSHPYAEMASHFGWLQGYALRGFAVDAEARAGSFLTAA